MEKILVKMEKVEKMEKILAILEKIIVTIQLDKADTLTSRKILYRSLALLDTFLGINQVSAHAEKLHLSTPVCPSWDGIYGSGALHH
jgi:hypothetical protein